MNEIVCEGCGVLLATVAPDALARTEFECRCGQGVRSIYSPQGWSDAFGSGPYSAWGAFTLNEARALEAGE